MIKQKLSLFSYAIWTVLPLGLILLGSLWFVGNLNLTRAVKAEIEQNVVELGDQIAVRAQERLDGVIKFTNSVARNSLVINGLIDFEGRNGYLPAFFRSLEAPSSSKARFWMVDYKAREIAKSHQGAPVPALDQANLDQTVLVLHEDELIVSQPIHYQGAAEGALVARFPAAAYAEIFDITGPKFHLGIEGVDGALIYVSDADLRKVLTAKSEAATADWIIYRKKLASHGLTLIIARPSKDALVTLEAVKSMQLIGLGSYLVLALFLVLLTAYILMKPLKQFSGKLATVDAIGNLDHKLTTNGPREIANLALAFNGMFDRLKASAKETEQLNLELRDAQKMEAIGQLAGGIAHEINTPSQYIGDNLKFINKAQTKMLDTLVSVSSILENTAEQDDPQAQVMVLTKTVKQLDIAFLKDEVPQATSEAISGVKQVSRIVLAMKEFSHPGTKEKTAVNVNRSLENTLTVSRNAWKRIAEVKTEFDPNLPNVFCLPGELNQVFLNLIVNAAHAIDEAGKNPENGCIEIITRKHTSAVEIMISDNGIGMSEEVRSRVFEPFFTTKGVGRGTGQGLAIAHDIIVNKHGGRITVESEKGQGTSFSLLLPLNDCGILPNAEVS